VAKTVSYADAVKLLGSGRSPVITALDTLAGRLDRARALASSRNARRIVRSGN
jgi:hypothetical protein